MPSRRLLFGLLTPAQGGHTRTALALGEVMRERGHRVEFVVSAAADTARHPSDGTPDLLRAAAFPVHRVADPYRGLTPRAFQTDLGALVRQGAYDALHWFELHAGVWCAARIARAERCAFIWTVTSGGGPGEYCGLNRVAVYTPEVAADVRGRSPRTAVHLLAARLDVRSLDATFIADARRTIRTRHGIDDREVLIVRVARCANVYLRSVRAGVALTRRLNDQGRRAAFLHAGYVEDAQVAAEIGRIVDEANQTAGRRIAQSITENLDAGTRYAAAADVCIGSGRTALEALALGRPTLVVWGSRFPGLVDDANIEAMAAANFQGRLTEKVESDDALVAGMEEAVRSCLSGADRSGEAGARAAAFVRARYSVESAADAYEALYADRTITVDGPVAYYANLRQLGREAFYRLPIAVRYSRAVNLLRRTQWWPGLGRNE